MRPFSALHEVCAPSDFVRHVLMAFRGISRSPTLRSGHLPPTASRWSHLKHICGPLRAHGVMGCDPQNAYTRIRYGVLRLVSTPPSFLVIEP